MKCELAQQHIALFAYDELPDEQCHALEQHLVTCENCQKEMQAMRALQQAVSFIPIEEPSANLLARTRLRLEEALDAMPRNRLPVRVWQAIIANAASVARAPLAASGLLALGIGLGGFSGYHFAQQPRPAQHVAATVDPALRTQVANVSSIVEEPNSENVEVHYNRLVPETVRGSLDDPGIRKLLLLGASSRVNPSVQQNSVSLLADECRAGHLCSNGPVRDALLVALRYDKSAPVRLKALEGLQPYVAEDVRVRDAVLESLMNDSDPAVRAQAIGLLEPVQADSSVRQVLHTVASEDANPHIRTVSREVLDQLPQIQ